MMQYMVIDFVQGGPVDYKKMLSLGLIEKHADGYVLSSLGASFVGVKK